MWKKKTLRGGIRRVLVELMVIETTTSSMRTKRSTNNIGNYSATPAQMQIRVVAASSDSDLW